MSNNDRTKLEPKQLAVPVPDRRRANMYETIARVHKDIVQVKWQARAAKQPFSLNPNILLHLEESLAFLAEDLLNCQAENEKRFNALEPAAEKPTIQDETEKVNQ